jgi:translation initiation factor IF-1
MSRFFRISGERSRDYSGIHVLSYRSEIISKRDHVKEKNLVAKEEKLFVDGTVIESLRNRNFRVELEDKQRVLGYLSGKMTKNYIRVTIGDRVRVEVSPYDLKRGRITYRYRN